MTSFQRIRLAYHYSLLPLVKLATIAVSRLPGVKHAKIANMAFIGPQHIIDKARNVLADVEYSSPDLYAILSSGQPIAFYYCPWMQKDVSYMRHFFVGNESICWDKAGILAHLVWTAMKLKVNLQKPAIAFHDHYTGAKLLKRIALEMSNWLTDHNQPSELAQDFWKYAAER